LNKVLVVLTATMSLFFTNLVHAGCGDILNEIFAGNSCTKIRTYRSADVSDKPILVVALHGDSPFNNPGYQYRFAKLVANKNSNVISVGMLRPGYTDPLGRTSDGVKGDAIGDNYDKKRVNQVAQAITELKKLYSPSKVILAGHSGGAAITANLISLFPLLIDHAFIVSCPCDVNAWREDMFSLTKKSIFRGNIETLSPIDLVEHLSKKTIISIFVGKDDKVARPILSEKYKTAATKEGLKVTLEVIDGQHDIFLSPDIINAITEIVSGYNNSNAADAKSRAAD
jgi:predicted esterase